MIPDNLKVIILLTLLVGAVIAFWYGLILIGGGKVALWTLAAVGGVSVLRGIASTGQEIVESVTGREEK